MWLKYLCFRELEAADRRDIRLSRKSRPARLGHHRSPRPWDIIAARSEDIVIVGSLTQAARTLLRAAAVLLPCLLLAACLYRGNIDDPMTIKATWLSYLNGDDMRAACVEGAPLQYRLIYNADYDEQLRSYEVTGTPGSDGDAGGGRLVVRVLGSSGIAVRSEERRGGTECVSTCRSRWSRCL